MSLAAIVSPQCEGGNVNCRCAAVTLHATMVSLPSRRGVFHQTTKPLLPNCHYGETQEHNPLCHLFNVLTESPS